MNPVVLEAKRRLKEAVDAEEENRTAAQIALRFAAGDQWPADAKADRQMDRRPCLTINKTNVFCRSVENNMRQQRPRIKVDPVSAGANQGTADVIKGLIRHIETNSNADLAYDTGAHYQTRIGFGYWRVNGRYIADDSFDQELFIDRIRNPFSVYMGPHSSPDGSDCEWCLITARVPRDEFKRDHPKADPIDVGDRGAGDEDVRGWATPKEVVVAEYLRFECKPEKLYQLPDGKRLFESQLPSDDTLRAAYGVAKDAMRSRDSMRRQLKWSKVTGREELDSRDLPGRFLPVIPVYGEELIEEGKAKRYGMVRDLTDPQRMYNYWRTMETEFVALAPKSPWVMAEGQDEGYENEWRNAHIKSYAKLTYKPVSDESGAMLPPPQRQQPMPIPAAQVNAAMSASEDMKAVAGIFDPSLGAPGEETSGIMVQRRQGQSDLSNFHYYDNQVRSIRHTGKVLLDLIPSYYDTQRVIRIIGDDGTPDNVTINEKQLNPQTGAIEKVLHDMTVGLYDVVMDTGPGYQTKLQESTEKSIQLLKVMPQVGQAAGDLMVRNMDLPGAASIADRLEAMNPIAMADKQLPKDLPQEVRTTLATQQGTIQQLQHVVQQLTMEKEAKLWGVHAKEIGDDYRAQLAARTKVHDTDTRAHVDLVTARLESETDLKIHRDENRMSEARP